MKLSRRSVLGLLAILVCAVSGAALAAEPPRPLIVYAAASLGDVLPKISDAYTKATGVPVTLSFAASSTLARQIDSGAEADVYLSADEEWMDYLAGRSRIVPASRLDLLGNRLALIAPADSKLELKVSPGFALAAALNGQRLATGDPDSVPAGRYAKAALIKLGVWSEVTDRLVRSENVRGALAFVARGEVPLGIVYETDARADRRVRIVDLFPEATHAPITYPVATTRTAQPAAAGYVDFLRSAPARALFEQYGFKTLAPAGH